MPDYNCFIFCVNPSVEILMLKFGIKVVQQCWSCWMHCICMLVSHCLRLELFSGAGQILERKALGFFCRRELFVRHCIGVQLIVSLFP